MGFFFFLLIYKVFVGNMADCSTILAVFLTTKQQRSINLTAKKTVTIT